MFEEISISFENPATDPMGFGAVTGKLSCLRDCVRLQFKEKDRAFRKNETQTVDLEYSEIENLELIARWFRPVLFILETRALEKLDDFPGSQVGRVEMMLPKSSRQSAKKMINLIEFQKSERNLLESEKRLDRDVET